MNRAGIIGFLVIILLGCDTAKRTIKVMEVDFKELKYGICETEAIYSEKMTSSPSGKRTYSSGFKLLEQTERVPAILGQKFGIEYEITSSFTGEITVEQVWIFPTKIRDENGGEFKEVRYKIDKSTNERTYSTYTLEKDYEVVKGEWTYQMYFNGKRIHERKFYLE